MSNKLYTEPSRSTSKLSRQNHDARMHSSPIFNTPLQHPFQRFTTQMFTALMLVTALLGIASLGVSSNHVLASPAETIVADDVVMVSEDSSVSIEILANDAPMADLDMDSLKILLAPSYGSFAIQPTFEIVYTPYANFSGEDLFAYQICAKNDSTCGTALVSIQVDPTNDQLIAADDSATAQAGVPVEIDVLANDLDYDLDMDVSTLSIVSATVRGITQIVDNHILYTANEAGGVDQFSYEICDNPASSSDNASCSIATVQITLGETDTIPQQVTAEGTLNIAPSGVDRNSPPTLRLINTPDNGNVIVELDGTLTYEPVADFTGTDAFMVEICSAADDCRTVQYSVTVGTIQLRLPFVML